MAQVVTGHWFPELISLPVFAISSEAVILFSYTTVVVTSLIIRSSWPGYLAYVDDISLIIALLIHVLFLACSF